MIREDLCTTLPPPHNRPLYVVRTPKRRQSHFALIIVYDRKAGRQGEWGSGREVRLQYVTHHQATPRNFHLG
jgi:hypothetical protein